MSVIEAIRMARENGVRLGVAGADLILDEDREPAPQVLEAIRRHKAGIVALLTAAKGDWTAEEWRVFYHERAGNAEFDGRQSWPSSRARRRSASTRWPLKPLWALTAPFAVS